MDHLRKILRIFIWCIIDIVILAVIAAAILIIHIESELPNVSVLKDVQMQVPLRIYTNDGKLLAEYGEKRRIPVPYEQIPPQLVNAVLATEDQRFFEHPGVDFRGLMRAAVQLVTTGTKSQGGSTITMQVARNFFLSPQKTYTRKLKEILLAMKIEQALSKQKILDLYLNKIYFGNRAYGVAAAAQVYYGKSLDQLTIPEMAMIAGLPKAPSGLNPITHPEAALDRRNHVLARMLEHNCIDQKTFDVAVATPETAKYHDLAVDDQAPFVAEMVRNAMVNQFGAEQAYTAGYSVYTTIDPDLQRKANIAVTDALLDYEHRHGYRGAVKNLGSFSPSKKTAWLNSLDNIPSQGSLLSGAVTSLTNDSANVLLANGNTITINWDGMKWARKPVGSHYLGSQPQSASNIMRVGDVIYVRQLANGQWELDQLPRVEGALVAIKPDNGAIVALNGGFDYYRSKFNRITQAKRQPGSSFKPFVYAAALDKGFTLATVINDAPITVDMPDGSTWQPQNSNKKFYGPTRLRVALSKSRNLVSVRLLQLIGIDYTVKYLQRFGFQKQDIPPTLSLALGTASVTPLELASGYCVFANGGYQVKPYFIDHITDADNNVIYQAKPEVACEKCIAASEQKSWNNPDAQAGDTEALNESVPDNIAPLVISPQIAYLITSAMQDVIRQGTGKLALQMQRSDIAGKTGTTNDQKDAWFAGYNSDLVAVAWLGYDQPRSLYEYGAVAALPMWIDFMSHALQGKPEHTMPEPPGLVTVRINPNSGYPAGPHDNSNVFETFRAGDSHDNPEQPANDWHNPDESDSDINSNYGEPAEYEEQAQYEQAAPADDESQDEGGIHIF